MSSVMKRQRSRRQLAAVTFLSNISLDGTHRDTKLASYNYGRSLNKNYCDDPSKTEEKENLEEPTLEGSFENLSLHTCKVKVRKEVNLEEDFPLHSSSIFKEKELSIEQLERPTFHKKRSIHGVTTSEKSYFSSNESLVGILPGRGGRTRKSSSTWSEASVPPTREIRFLKPIHGHQFKEERVVLLSSSKMPYHLYSSLPYTRQRIDIAGKEVGRRRNVSGTRPLSTISDSTDPAHILGLVCFEENAEASYSDLLVPSKHFFSKSKLRHGSEQVDFVDGNGDRFIHPGLARCFSYEPATHKATAHYLPHATYSCYSERDEISCAHMTSSSYMPNVVDDPELRAGKHRKLLRFASYMTSIIDYTKPSELKKELNDKFKEKFPHIQLTLSKLRSLKREMVKIARHECNIDLLTVAQAYAYFEKLILQIAVNKQNRKLIAGACLILSAKMNDVKGDALSNLIEKTECVFRLSRRELLQWEFASLVALEFGLHMPVWQINPHYQRLIYES